jgi:replicative DNA helicase
MFKKSLDIIKESADKISRGLVNSIPFTNFPSLFRHVPGIIKGLFYIITASSGIGKTQLTKHLFVIEPYNYIKDNPDKNIKLKILYFALEESREEFMFGLISNRLYTEYGLEVSVIELQSFTEKLSNDTISKIEKCEEYFEDFEKYIEVVDTVYNPTGLYKYVKSYADSNGTHIYKDITINKETVKVYDYYKPNNPNEFVIVITDHISLLQEEKDRNTGMMMTKHQTISKWSADYCRKQISKHFKYTVVNVQQQEAAKEKQEYFRGGSVESKLEPSLDGLADNKLTQRDALVVLGLFAPDRYEIRKHLNYDVTILKDNYRSLKILKNRLGRPNLKIGLYFDGKTNYFKQLPKWDSEEINLLYDEVENKNRK